jgi:hypothetical protein
MLNFTLTNYHNYSRHCMLAFCLLISSYQLYAQCPSSINVSSPPTTVGASCPSSGQVTIHSNVENLTTPTYQIISATEIGTNSPLDGYQTTSQSSNNFSGLPAGNYTVKISCGTVSQDVTFTIDNLYTQPTLTPSVSNVCAGGNTGGTITATATGGKPTLVYGFLQSTNAAEPDANFSYQSTNVFSAPGFGVYQVRVKDACNNFTTASVDLQPSSPKASITFASRSYSCTEILMNGSILRTASGTINPLNSGYTLELYYLNDSDPCSQPATPASGATGQTIHVNSGSDMNLHVPANTEKMFYRVISPCGEVTSGCQDLTPLNFSATAAVHVGCPDGDAVSLAIRPNGSAPYTAVVQGFNASNNPVAPNGITYNFNANSAATGVPYAHHYNYTVTDACGRTFSGSAVTPVPADGATVTSITTSLTCTNVVGTSQVSVNVSGYIPDRDASSIALLDATNTVVATAASYNPQSGIIVFNNIPAGSYFIRFDPTDASCASVTNIPLTIAPYSNPLIFSLDGTASQLCGGTGTITSHLTYNASAASSTVSYTLLNGTTVVSTNASGIFTNLAPGTYTLTATATAGCRLASLTASKELVIQPSGSDPVVVKKLGINCSNDPATGMAVFEFSGFGPFKFEMKKTTETVYNTVNPAVPNSYTATGLSADTDYDVRITDQCGKTQVTQVSVRPLVAVTVTNSQQPCLNQPYTLSAEEIGGATYSWTFNGTPLTGVTGKDVVFGTYTAANNGSYQCTIKLGDCITRIVTVNLNSINCNQPLTNSGLGDFVWIDSNINGIQDAGEQGQGGITVTLYAADGTTSIAVTTTDANGYYYFPNLTSGSYVVGFSNLPSGYSFSPNTGALYDPNNSDAGTNGKTGVIVLADNEFNLNIDAGIYNSLPVTLISFNAKVVEKDVHLNWSTSAETNSDYFEIERSIDARSWLRIGRIASHRESATLKNYVFTDKTSLPGQNFYRLRMVDTDLTFAYSRIVSVQMEAKEDLLVYPNPVSDVLFITNLTSSPLKEISIISTTGKSVYQSQSITSDGINLKSLSSGVYILQIKRVNGTTEVKKLLIAR